MQDEGVERGHRRCGAPAFSPDYIQTPACTRNVRRRRRAAAQPGSVGSTDEEHGGARSRGLAPPVPGIDATMSKGAFVRELPNRPTWWSRSLVHLLAHHPQVHRVVDHLVVRGQLVAVRQLHEDRRPLAPILVLGVAHRRPGPGP